MIGLSLSPQNPRPSTTYSQSKNGGCSCENFPLLKELESGRRVTYAIFFDER